MKSHFSTNSISYLELQLPSCDIMKKRIDERISLITNGFPFFIFSHYILLHVFFFRSIKHKEDDFNVHILNWHLCVSWCVFIIPHHQHVNTRQRRRKTMKKGKLKLEQEKKIWESGKIGGNVYFYFEIPLCGSSTKSRQSSMPKKFFQRFIDFLFVSRKRDLINP